MPQIELTNGEALMMIKNAIIKTHGCNEWDEPHIYIQVLEEIEEILEMVGYG